MARQITSEASSPPDGMELEQAQVSSTPILFNEVSPEVQQKIDLLDAILQAPSKEARRAVVSQNLIREKRSVSFSFP